MVLHTLTMSSTGRTHTHTHTHACIAERYETLAHTHTPICVYGTHAYMSSSCCCWQMRKSLRALFHMECCMCKCGRVPAKIVQCVIVHFVTSLIAYMRLCRTPHCHCIYTYILAIARGKIRSYRVQRTSYIHHYISTRIHTRTHTHPQPSFTHREQNHVYTTRYVRVLLICQNKPAMLLLFSIF